MKFPANVDNGTTNRWLNFADALDGHLATRWFLKIQSLEHCHMIKSTKPRGFDHTAATAYTCYTTATGELVVIFKLEKHPTI